MTGTLEAPSHTQRRRTCRAREQRRADAMPENLNGRWIIEDQWEGDECVWHNPFNEPNSLTELTIQTEAEVEAHRQVHGGTRVVQVKRWPP